MEFEALSGQRYEYVYRIRTDSVFFAPFPADLLQQNSSAYVPFGGMTGGVGVVALPWVHTTVQYAAVALC